MHIMPITNLKICTFWLFYSLIKFLISIENKYIFLFCIFAHIFNYKVSTFCIFYRFFPIANFKYCIFRLFYFSFPFCLFSIKKMSILLILFRYANYAYFLYGSYVHFGYFIYLFPLYLFSITISVHIGHFTC